MSESNPSDAEIDALLIAQAKQRWQKVAMIVAKAFVDSTWCDEERISSRVVALVEAGILDSKGDVRNWRFSEVRLPSSA